VTAHFSVLGCDAEDHVLRLLDGRFRPLRGQPAEDVLDPLAVTREEPVGESRLRLDPEDAEMAHEARPLVSMLVEVETDHARSCARTSGSLRYGLVSTRGFTGMSHNNV